MSDLIKQFEPEKTTGDSHMTEVAQSRAQHEVQAAFVIAKKFPRDEFAAIQKIMKACKRHSLAEKAIYMYPRGGTQVEGPSIRLAEAIASSWGNIDCGVREVSQSNGVSVAEAYAIDLETNTRVTKTFHVKHERHTKKGVTKLKDTRDIYELVANQGARRLRACILGVIPGDIVEEATYQCRKTLESSDEPIEQRIKRMVNAFDELGVKIEHLEKRLGHNLDVTTAHELVTLQSIYRSIKDGMASREQYFDIALKNQLEDASQLKDLVKKKETKKESSE